MLKGLKLENDIFNLLKREFERFCREVTSDVKLTPDDKKLLLAKKVISVLASNVGKGKAVPETRQDCMYLVMKSILSRAKVTDRLD